jgi:hypothetical protein
MKLILALLAAASIAPRADTLVFSVAPGTKIGKQLELSLELATQHVSISIGGQELPEEVLKKFEMSMSNTIELAVEDEYTALEDGRPSALVRRFQSAKSHAKSHDVQPGRKPADKDEELESPLAGHAVEFQWNAKEHSFERAYKGSESDKAALEPLKADMDLLVLLHPGTLAEGASWKIEPKFIGDLVKPGGELSFPRQKDSNMQFEFSRNPSGTIEASYAGTRESGGRKFGIVKVVTHIKSAQAADPEKPTSFALEGTLELEGEYLWDLERGRLASYSIRGPATLSATGEREVETKAGKAPMKLRFEFSGELKSKGSFD